MSGQALAVILGVALALRLALLFEPPNLSTDAYRYVWDGRVQGAGVNPYLHVPAAPALEALRDEAIFPHINRRDYAVTIYPPAAQMLFALVNRVSDGLLAMKLALVACEAVTAAVLVDLLRRLRRPVTRVVAYALAPARGVGGRRQRAHRRRHARRHHARPLVRAGAGSPAAGGGHSRRQRRC